MPEGRQLLGDALGIVQPIDAEDDRAVDERLVKIPSRLGHYAAGSALRELLEIDADREAAHTHHPLAYLRHDHLALTLQSYFLQQRADALGEVPAVAQGLKPDHIIGQQRAQYLEAPGQLEEDVQRRKGNVQKET